MASALPEGIIPLFLTAASSAIFNCKPNVDVTAEKPYVWINLQQIVDDVAQRRVISDFQPYKDMLVEKKVEKVLLVFDSDWKYGQNFYFIHDVELAKKTFDADQLAAGGAAAAKKGPKKVKAKRVPQKWVSLGSDKELDESIVVENRKLITIEYSSKLRNLRRGAELTDTETKINADFKPFADETFTVKQVLVDKAVQAVQEQLDKQFQSLWIPKSNKSIQYTPLIATAEQISLELQSADLAAALKLGEDKIQRAIYENVLMENQNGKDELMKQFTIDQEGKVAMKENQSFLDLKRSKDKTVSCIRWHPSVKEIIGMCCISKLTVEDKLEDYEQLAQEKHEVIVWNFKDPINPFCYLEAPVEIYTFDFHPDLPNIVVGGGVDGKLFVWDLKDKLYDIDSSNVSVQQKQSSLPGSEFLRPKKDDLIIPVSYASANEESHRDMVMDIHFISKKLQDMIIPTAHSQNATGFVVSASMDASLFIWGVKQPNEIAGEMWSPLKKISLISPDGSVDYGCTKFGVSLGVVEIKDKKQEFCQFICGSQDGDVVRISLNSIEGPPNGMDISVPYHVGAVMDIKQSPFNPEYTASIAGSTLALWRSLNMKPIIVAECPGQNYSAIEWSLTRPAVLFAARVDGGVEIWDFLQKIHQPIVVQSIGSVPLVTLSVRAKNDKYVNLSTTEQNMIAVGDDNGSMFVLHLPKTLTRPVSNELAQFNEILKREYDIVKTELENEKAQAAALAAEQQKKQAASNLAAVTLARQGWTIAKDFSEHCEKFIKDAVKIATTSVQ